MVPRSLGRAAVLAATGVLAVAGLTSADSIRADGDLGTTTVETTVDLGAVPPSAQVSVDVGFVLKCTSFNHVDQGQVATFDYETGAEPTGGSIVSVGSGSVGPVPPDWPGEGDACPSPAPELTGGSTSQVVLRAPATVGTGYEYTVMWSASLSPAGTFDSTSIRGAAAVTFRLDVVADTAPVLVLPADETVEGDTTGGWTAAYSVGATDAEDDPDPAATCDPAVGDVVPLGTTHVSCSVTDGGGLSDTGSFAVTVVDTTTPHLSVPGDLRVSTGDLAGRIVTFADPGMSDIVDASPTGGCSPASGSAFPVGTTTVHCTATDASGNTARGSFQVVVDYVAPHSATAAWGEPVAGPGLTFSANRGRTIPVKVVLTVDRLVRTTGSARLQLIPCGATSPEASPALTFGGGRWNASIDTSALAGGCYRVAARIDGLEAGSFGLELRGVEAAKAKPKP